MQDYAIEPINDSTEDGLAVFITNLQASLGSLLSTIEGKVAPGSEAAEICAYLERISTEVGALTKDTQLKTASINRPSTAIVSIVRKVADSTSQFTYCSPVMHNLVELAEKAAKSDAPVLITGETGVGKELIARLIHRRSYRSRSIMIPFNCAAISRDLFESHLFGHKYGAFTGALRDNQGVIRASAGGTLLLDEIGELPIDLQPKLLRFLQEGEIHTVGQARPSQVDVRVLASTNRDLESEVAAGRFRSDLYYRLNIIRLYVPPLRERYEDVPLLMRYFFNRYSNSSSPLSFAPDALGRLLSYEWPGNVRELSSLVMRFVTMAAGKTHLELSDLPPEIINTGRVSGFKKQHQPLAFDNGNVERIRPVTLADEIRLLERQKVSEAMARYNGNFIRAARHLGLSTFGLRKKYRRLFPKESAKATYSLAGNYVKREVVDESEESLINYDGEEAV